MLAIDIEIIYDRDLVFFFCRRVHFFQDKKLLISSDIKTCNVLRSKLIIIWGLIIFIWLNICFKNCIWILLSTYIWVIFNYIYVTVSFLFSLSFFYRGAIRFIRVNILLWWWETRGFTVARVFSRLAERHPEKVAYILEDKEWTYQQVRI